MILREYINNLKQEILELKNKRNAIILAHNYQRPEIQEVADFIGSSLELARKAQNLESKVIVFCGVDFMANTAKILNPDKTVIMPDYRAGCPLARMLKPGDILKAKEKYPKAPVLLYTNSDVECQALADAIYTAGNVLRIIEKMVSSESDEVIIGPDVNISYYVGKRINIDKKIVAVPSYSFCSPHVRILPEFVEKLKSEHPNAKFMAHMECLPAVQEMADYVGSTGDMTKWVKEDSCREWIVGTVESFIYRLKKGVPDKEFYPIRYDEREISRCPNMDLTSLEEVVDSLENFDEVPVHNPTKKEYYNTIIPARRIEIPEELANKARKAIDYMLRL